MARCFSYLWSIGKRWLTWSWTYLWLLWLMLVLFLIYVLRGPLKINENLNKDHDEKAISSPLPTHDLKRYGLEPDPEERRVSDLDEKAVSSPLPVPTEETEKTISSLPDRIDDSEPSPESHEILLSSYPLPRHRLEYKRKGNSAIYTHKHPPCVLAIRNRKNYVVTDGVKTLPRKNTMWWKRSLEFDLRHDYWSSRNIFCVNPTADGFLKQAMSTSQVNHPKMAIDHVVKERSAPLRRMRGYRMCLVACDTKRIAEISPI